MDQTAPRSIARRRFLRTAAGTTAGMASWLALHNAPAFAQKRELTFLSWNHFVPASDDELRKQAEAFGKQANCTVRVDTIAHLQLPAKHRGRGAVPVGPRHAPDRVGPIRSSTRTSSRTSATSSTTSARSTAAGIRSRPEGSPDQVRLAGHPVVLDLVPGHLQPGPLQEGRARQPPKTWDELLKDGKILKKQGNPVGIPISHCCRRQHDVLVGGVVLRAPRSWRPTARRPPSTRTRPHRSSSGTRSSTGTRWSPRSCPGTTRPTTASSSPARARGSTTRSARTTRRSPRSSRSPTTSITTTAPGGRRASTQPRPSTWHGHLEVLQEPGAGQGVHRSTSSRRRTSTRGSWPPTPSTIRRCKNFADHPIWARNPKFAMLPKEAEYAHPAAGRPSRATPCSASTTTTSCPTWSPRPSTACRPSGPWTGPRSRSPSRIKGQLKVG